MRGVAAFLLLVFVVYLGVLSINIKYRRKVEGLLHDIQTLRVGESTTADVQRIMSRYGGGKSESRASFCELLEGAYGVSIGGQAVVRFEQLLPVLSRLGARPWAVGATVLLRGGRVCYVSYRVMMQSPTRTRDWLVESELVPEGTINWSDAERSRYWTTANDIRNLRVLRSQAAPLATEEQRREAFGYDFSCVSSLIGCRARCQIAPLMWRDAYRESLLEGWSMPPEEARDPRCKLGQQLH